MLNSDTRKSICLLALMSAAGSLSWFISFVLRDGPSSTRMYVWPVVAAMFAGLATVQFLQLARMPSETTQSRASVFEKVLWFCGAFFAGGILLSFLCASVVPPDPANAKDLAWGFHAGFIQYFDSSRNLPALQSNKLWYDIVAFFVGAVCLFLALMVRLISGAAPREKVAAKP